MVKQSIDNQINLFLILIFPLLIIKESEGDEVNNMLYLLNLS
jgi:hypothetical protein